ncbi:hypothetical protein [Actinomycetospora termitidis]|uniref:Uncharacterized protein n=1 Tax=Actinomycetospora termitidis TaxID=3053470 RepID=A0ABT7M3A4_9PSEU|nr:hypothetical protein [Actinomycetospora sp. Odt1-22]MDL5155145.1 hypothetical protein [Actinomycetospora sp. Odt1-22]
MDAGLVQDERRNPATTTHRNLSSVPQATERPRPRWREAVGASVLLSVLDTVRAEETAATA